MPPLKSPNLRKLVPLLTLPFLFACEEGGVYVLEVKGAFEPASLDFGDVPVETGKPLPVVLKNVGTPAFDIEEVSVPEGFAIRGIKGEFVGRQLLGGTEIDFEVLFIPTREAEYVDTLTINISQGKVVELPLRGNGRMIRIPAITATPATVNFGVVELGAQGTAMVTLQNSGNSPGTVVGASLESTGIAISVGDVFKVATPLPMTVAEAGGTQPLQLVFSPATDGVRQDRIFLKLAEDVPVVPIEVTGEGRTPFGEIFCEPGRIDYGATERGTVASRTVTCTARGGPARLIGAHIEGATDQFFVPSPPNTADLSAEESFDVVVEFRPEGLPSLQNGTLVVDFSGANGNGTAEVQLNGEVVPPPPTETAITVVLSWNSNNTDVDLHMVRPMRPNPADSLFEQDADCYFGNRSPDWNAPGASDDPFLDQDDVDGYGPETINLEQTSAGQYDVFVHYYSDNTFGSTTPTVEIHLAGQLAGTYDRPGFSCDDIWHVGTIHWDGANGTFSPTNNVMPSNEGSCF